MLPVPSPADQRFVTPGCSTINLTARWDFKNRPVLFDPERWRSWEPEAKAPPASSMRRYCTPVCSSQRSLCLCHASP